VYGKELKLNKDNIIKLNIEFHGFVDDNEPEYIQSDLGDMIVKYDSKNELQNEEARLKHSEEEYNKTLDNNNEDGEDVVIDIKELETKSKQCEDEYNENKAIIIVVLMSLK
jgi:hypothetical protein